MLAIVPTAFAYYGGDSITYHFEKCNAIEVNITTAELNEFILNDCAEISPGYFECNCSDDYDLNITPAANSVGTFNISITNYYDQEVETVEVHTSGATRTVYVTTTIQNETAEELVENLTELANEYITKDINKSIQIAELKGELSFLKDAIPGISKGNEFDINGYEKTISQKNNQINDIIIENMDLQNNYDIAIAGFIIIFTICIGLLYFLIFFKK